MNATLEVWKYRIPPPFYWVIRDAEEARNDSTERLLFHIKTGDYFAMLATALGFVEEALVDKKEGTEADVGVSPELVVLRNMKRDLIFLNARYNICEKTEKRYEITL